MRIQLRTGDIYKTNQGYSVEISDFNSKSCVTVVFENGHKTTTTFQNIVKGQVKNPFHPFVAGTGFIGHGSEIAFCDGKESKAYRKWSLMINRCYGSLIKDAYLDCSVCNEWHNFQNFSKWFKDNYTEGFELDKDILIKGNRIYCPDACCFVPRAINLLFTKRKNNRGLYPIGVNLHKSGKFYSQISLGKGKSKSLGLFKTPEDAFLKYKTAKELFIKETADRYKSKISQKTYDTLINYEIKITD